MQLLAVLVAALGPLASAQLHERAREAGLKYFGSATDTPGEREHAGLEAAYPQYDAIMWDTREFGQTTPDNGMKWEFSEPEPGVFNFTEGEVVSSLAEEAGQLLRCHTLIWHSQLAPWVEQTNWTAEALRDVVTERVAAMAGHWKGRCYAWDVVNEALEADGSYRRSVFYDVLGDEFIKLAFRAAAEADPDAKLYYNEYDIEFPGPKNAATVRLVKMLQAEGIRIDGVGLQSHLDAATAPTLDQHVEALESFTNLGVETALTELDVRIRLPYNDTSLALQREAYKNAVGACVQVDGCVGVTLWDFYDAFSWIPAFYEGEGAATLWFDNFTHHPAYDGVIEALENGTSSETR